MYEKAKILLGEGSVKEYIFENKKNSVFLVVGRHSQYVISVCVINDRLHFFCSCPDFFFHTLLKSAEKRRPFCQHILAVVLKEKNRLERGETKKSALLEEEEYWLELLSDLIT
ncbi:MAG: hypothetical protein GWO20_01150 [Candidatus Korarchaeota archaeon]|nr:hypothetical protein [Candidatus Korarchaeota archaeon]NIU83051.1 hypothetical protein [Candidatus Thorarchaeota archaeon]NIW12595.1 hypothetical protein [Candidatus Thorarchaeota archaeon]NIW50806.1 hypothetical protein [Candidatus Korarchaeota archaeon]